MRREGILREIEREERYGGWSDERVCCAPSTYRGSSSRLLLVKLARAKWHGSPSPGLCVFQIVASTQTSTNDCKKTRNGKAHQSKLPQNTAPCWTVLVEIFSSTTIYKIWGVDLLKIVQASRERTVVFWREALQQSQACQS